MTPLDINDTICAISTPPGTGGIAVIRISGPQAITIANSIWHGKDLTDVPTHTAHLGTLIDTTESPATPLDQAVATVYRAPGSFTGQDTVELAVHGSPYVQTQTVTVLCHQGARPAMPGEFTRRAFASGHLDLPRAEAVADLIAATSRTAHRVALNQARGQLSLKLSQLRAKLIELSSLLELELDFGEEDVQFASRHNLILITTQALELLGKLQNGYTPAEILRDGIPVTIAGAPNAGKSSLLNHLLGRQRAIVSDIPGTTRDTIDATINIRGTLFRLTDTAGIRNTDDPIESIGVNLAVKQAAAAHILLLLTPADNPTDTTAADLLPRLSPDTHIIHLITKADLSDPETLNNISTQIRAIDPTPAHPILPISTRLEGDMTQPLLDKLIHTVPAATATADDIILTQARHLDNISKAIESLRYALTALTDGTTADFIAQDIRRALHHIGEITGEITADDILTSIFTRFCIGK